MAPRSKDFSRDAAEELPRPGVPLFKPGVDVPKALRFVPTDTPRYSVPVAGQDYVGLLGPYLKGKPLFSRLNWLHVVLILGLPLIAIYGISQWAYDARTLAFAVFYYFFTGLGITAGAR
jgi:hypothetical protein